MTRRKGNAKVLIGIGALGIIGYYLYTEYYKPKAPPTPTPTPEPTPVPIPYAPPTPTPEPTPVPTPTPEPTIIKGYYESDIKSQIAEYYRIYLHRLPDPDGLIYYFETFKSCWDFFAIQTDIANSDEAFIIWCYNTYLKREPDSGGMAHYMELLRSGWSKDQVEWDIRQSPEAQSIWGGTPPDVYYFPPEPLITTKR